MVTRWGQEKKDELRAKNPNVFFGLLQPGHCYSCIMVQIRRQSRFSHQSRFKSALDWVGASREALKRGAKAAPANNGYGEKVS